MYYMQCTCTRVVGIKGVIPNQSNAIITNQSSTIITSTS